MKYSERFFKFPVKIYHGRDWSKVEKDIEKYEDGADIDIVEPNYAKGWERVQLDEIVSISPTLSVFSPVENGVTRTEIHLRNGHALYSIWDPEKFTQKLDEFVDKLEEKQFEYEQMKTEQIKKMLEENLNDIKEKYKQEGLTLNLENYDPRTEG